MATQGGNAPDQSFVAGEDLSAKQFHFVKVNASGAVVACTVAGERGIGVLQNKPLNGQQATVRVHGITKLKAGGAVTAGDVVKSSAAGQALAAAAATVNTSDAGAAADAVIGSYVMGQAMVSGVVGDVISVLITHSGAVSTTAA